MIRYLILILGVLALMPACAKYNTHLGRVNHDNSPFTSSQQGAASVSYGGAPINIVPQLVLPITRTVWIKGHRRPNGDYVGDYPLTIVFTQGQFEHVQKQNPVIPQSISLADGYHEPGKAITDRLPTMTLPTGAQLQGVIEATKSRLGAANDTK